MGGLSQVSFVTPALLWGLLLLPVLWLLLRAVPPAPVRRQFPAVILLLGLRDEDSSADRTPWWLLLLRLLAVALVIVGFAGPRLGGVGSVTTGQTPLLLVMDASWAGSADWADRQALADTLLQEAEATGRPAALMVLSELKPVRFQPAAEVRGIAAALVPHPWHPAPDELRRAIAALSNVPNRVEVAWISDGISYRGQDELLSVLQQKGGVTVYQGEAPVVALQGVDLTEGNVTVRAARSASDVMGAYRVQAHGRTPDGGAQVLAVAPLRFSLDEVSAEASLQLPPEVRSRITHFQIAGYGSAGATWLVDDRVRRREVALIEPRSEGDIPRLLSPLHYLEQALAPSVDLLQGTLTDMLPANPDVVILPDVAAIPAVEKAALTSWVEKGGVLLRFAGPRLAGSDLARLYDEPLMPVRLRAGGRQVGGAMSWGSPKALAPFGPDSPFYGLRIPSDVEVRAQVLAQPDPDLARRVIANLSDGTPLITRKALGQGQVVLVHVSADAEWSTLPLSGLFVQMLDRLAISTAHRSPDPAALAGTQWRPVQVLDGFGGRQPASTQTAVAGEDLLTAPLGAGLQPGLYETGSAGQGRQLARNTLAGDQSLTPAVWPEGVRLQNLQRPAPQDLSGWALALAVFALGLDVLATLALSGQLLSRIRPIAGVLVCGVALFAAGELRAQDAGEDTRTLPPPEFQRAASQLLLGYVQTGDPAVDEMSAAGMRGLSRALYARTSVEPGAPVGVDLSRDDLALFPFLYWPVTADQPLPDTTGYERLNRYLASGGMILFDTRDGDIAGLNGVSAAGRRLQQIARPLAIPALEPIPTDHVLTRSFYLLQDFPGRYRGRATWVEAAPASAEQIEGMPFRTRNDGVTPVVIGGNDWAAAWAVDDRGAPMVPIGRGFAGERQRELALRFGVNLILHVLSGNYKSDQVHVPALLERLGQ